MILSYSNSSRLKNNPKKTFHHPFETLFEKHWLSDPFIFALFHILALESPSSNLIEFSLFHLYYCRIRIMKLDPEEVTDQYCWELEFNLNSFIKVTIQKFHKIICNRPPQTNQFLEKNASWELHTSNKDPQITKEWF